ncbi:hypothetical protein A2U01_0032797, partial [Trifolium medium]|nr:hypothetical protein [Trifolium medium]
MAPEARFRKCMFKAVLFSSPEVRFSRL